MPGLRGIISMAGFLALILAALWKYSATGPRPERGGWGIDAWLTAPVNAPTREAYLGRLAQSGVGWLRERQPEASMRRLHQAGYSVVAFTTLNLGPERSGNQLPEDLREVYRAGESAGREFSRSIAAWEMVGEPDLGYCTDLPDRVAAYQKAVYLGIRRGAAEAFAQRGKGEGRGAKGKEQRAKGEGRSSEGLALGAWPSATKVPLVLMGALGLPPGPWLERFAANGGLDYTDAYNFHFYGHAKDLSGVIEAHRAAIAALGAKGEEHGAKGEERRASDPLPLALSPLPKSATALPIWITECGMEAVDRRDFLNPQRRQLQADFTLSAAKQALAAADVAVFMPFILVHENDPYAMTLSPTHTFPAWDAYAKFTRENPWPGRPLARKEPSAKSEVIVQWLPDNATCVPHKVSGTYRFKGGQAIRGELRVYNFRASGIEGRLDCGSLKFSTVSLAAEGKGQGGKGPIMVPSMGMVSMPVEFLPTARGYFRETFEARFVEEVKSEGLRAKSEEQGAKSEGEMAKGDGQDEVASVVSFGLEAAAKIEDFEESPLALRALPGGKIQFPAIEPFAAGEQVGVWTTMNGLRAKSEERRAKGQEQSAKGQEPSAKGQELSAKGVEHLPLTPWPSATAFWVDAVNTDPLAPAMAVAAIEGLPAFEAKGEGQGAKSSKLGAKSGACFLRLQLDKPMTKERKVLVILVDDRGQRYSIWENFGADYYGSRSDIWLNLEDFNADFWGRMSADYQFRPERIREVQLRLYLDHASDPVRAALSVLRAKR